MLVTVLLIIPVIFMTSNVQVSNSIGISNRANDGFSIVVGGGQYSEERKEDSRHGLQVIMVMRPQ